MFKIKFENLRIYIYSYILTFSVIENRYEIYVKLWEELYQLIQLYSSSDNHKFIQTEMRKLWPENSSK